MAGYDPTMRDSSDVFGLREPEIMPDGLMGDKVCLLTVLGFGAACMGFAKGGRSFLWLRPGLGRIT